MTFVIVIRLTHGEVDVRSTFLSVPKHIAIVRDWLAPADEIHVATVCTVVREMLGLPALFARLAFVVELSDRRFAQIVKSRPYHIANDVRTLYGVLPVGKGIARIAFRLPHHTLWDTFVVALSLVHHVVVAGNVENGSVRVVDFPVTVPGTESLGNRSGAIERGNDFLEFIGGVYHANVLTLNDFVAYAV